MDSDYLVERDLVGSLVVDCEGYICGRVGSFKVEPDRILMSLYGMEVRKVKVPDEEKLVEKLVSLVSARKKSLAELHTQIRRELGLPSSQRITLKELLRFAKARGIDVPTKMEDREEKVDRGTVDWNLVDKVGESELGRCILLKEPVEAMRRGVEIKEKVPYYGTEHLRGRLVIDASAKIIGSAEKILLRIGAPPGLSIRLERISTIELDDLDALVESLIPSRFKREIDLYKSVAKDLNLKGRFTAEEIKEKVPYYGTERLRGRLVIDASAKIIGSAEKILLRIGAPPGLSIRLERISKIELDDLDALVESLVPSHFKREIDLYKSVAKDLNLKGRFTAEEIKKKYLATWARMKKIEIPKKYEKRREVFKELPIDWSDIKRIGDIIILRKTLEDLMRPPAPAPKEEAVEEREEPPETVEEVTEPEEETEEREDWWREYLGT